MSLLSAGEVTVWAYLSPRNPALPTTTGLHYALSFDDVAPLPTVTLPDAGRPRPSGTQVCRGWGQPQFRGAKSRFRVCAGRGSFQWTSEPSCSAIQWAS